MYLMMEIHKKYFSVNLKKICHLLLLINYSITASLSYSDDSHYIVKKGDTLWSISRSNNVSINDLIEINDIETFSNGIPLIKDGDKIILFKKSPDLYKSYCLDPNESYHYNLSNLTNIETISKCLKILENELDPYVIQLTENSLLRNTLQKKLESNEKLYLNEPFWKVYLSDDRYIYFFYNLELSNLLVKEKNNKLNEENSDKLFDLIILEASLEGHKNSQNAVLSEIDYYFEKYKDVHQSAEISQFITKILFNLEKDIVDVHKDILYASWDDAQKKYKKYLNFDFSKLSTHSKTKFFLRMTMLTFDNEDIEHFKFLEDLIKHLESIEYDNRKIMGYDFIAYVNVLYVLINLDKYDEASQLYEGLYTKLNIKNTDSFYNLAKANMYSVDYGKINNFDVIEAFVLNASAIESLDIPMNEFLPKREKYISLIETDLPKGRYGADNEALMDWYSDTGYRLAYNNFCLKAETYFKKAFVIYETNKNPFRTDDIQEPIDLADCFLRQSKYSDASIYTRLAEKNLSEFKKPNIIFLQARILSQKILVDILKNNNENAYKQFLYLSNYLIENGKQISPLTRANDFRYFINDYIYQYDFFKKGNYEIEKAISPIELKIIYENILSQAQLERIRFDKTNKDLIELKNKLTKNKNDIQEQESLFQETLSEASFDKLGNLYSERKLIIEEILKNNQLGDLFNRTYSQYESMIKSLEEDEIIITYTLDTHRISVFLETKSDTFIRFVDVKQRDVLNLISNIRSSMNNFKNNFSYVESKDLYEILYKPISDILKAKNDIYLYGSELEDIPFGVLVSNFDNSNSISEYQRLVSVEWLIDRHSFARIYPLNIPKSTQFSNKFLGFANPDSFSMLGLPLLPNSINEVREISLASQNLNNDFILTNSEASKDILFNITDQTFERIVFATHTVPSGWLGLTNESGIVLADEGGDFLLTPSEIINLNLKSDIVLLSSCNSDNDGISDLYKSFLVAGANSVIYSNWNLETVSAEKFTESTFKIMLFDSLPKHEAMRRASLEIMNDYSNPIYAHPAFWGNFSIAYRSL